MENDPKRFVLTMKGAPEIIFARCSTITRMFVFSPSCVCLFPGEVNGELVFVPIDDQVRADYDKVQEVLSSFGERVLGTYSGRVHVAWF